MSTDPTNRNAAIHERPVLKLVRMDEDRRGLSEDEQNKLEDLTLSRFMCPDPSNCGANHPECLPDIEGVLEPSLQQFMCPDPSNCNDTNHPECWPDRHGYEAVEEEKAQPVRGRYRLTWLGAPPPCTSICPPGIFRDVDALRWLQHNVFKTDKPRSVFVVEASCCGCSGRIYLISGRGADFRAELQP